MEIAMQNRLRPAKPILHGAFCIHSLRVTSFTAPRSMPPSLAFQTNMH
jgi:hypothetical protein